MPSFLPRALVSQGRAWSREGQGRTELETEPEETGTQRNRNLIGRGANAVETSSLALALTPFKAVVGMRGGGLATCSQGYIFL